MNFARGVECPVSPCQSEQISPDYMVAQIAVCPGVEHVKPTLGDILEVDARWNRGIGQLPRNVIECRSQGTPPRDHLETEWWALMAHLDSGPSVNVAELDSAEFKWSLVIRNGVVGETRSRFIVVLVTRRWLMKRR